MRVALLFPKCASNVAIGNSKASVPGHRGETRKRVSHVTPSSWNDLRRAADSNRARSSNSGRALSPRESSICRFNFHDRNSSLRTRATLGFVDATRQVSRSRVAKITSGQSTNRGISRGLSVWNETSLTEKINSRLIFHLH